MRIWFYLDSPGTFCGLSRVMAMIMHKAGRHTDQHNALLASVTMVLCITLTLPHSHSLSLINIMHVCDQLAAVVLTNNGGYDFNDAISRLC